MTLHLNPKSVTGYKHVSKYGARFVAYDDGYDRHANRGLGVFDTAVEAAVVERNG